VETTMPLPIHLLERAYQLINANQIQNAELVLDAVVRVDPQNLEAWKTYLLIHQSQNDLDWLKERIIKTKELSEIDKTALVNYYHYLSKQHNGAEQAVSPTGSFSSFPLEKTKEITPTQETSVQFELIDVFDYPTKIERKENSTRLRRRAIYNPFAFGGIFKALSHTSIGKKIANYVQIAITLANDFVKDPKDVYARISSSPHFEKYIEVVLLALFIFGIRLVISSHFLGYLFLGMFFIGGRWWLLKFGNHRSPTLSDQVRVYLHENKSNLPVIKEVEKDQEQKSGKENLGKNIK
jgi:hypothetical protein